MLLIYWLPAVLAALMRELFKNDCQGDEECILGKIAHEQASYMLSPLVGVRELSSFAAGFTDYGGPAGTRFFNELSRFGVQVGQGEVDAGLLRTTNAAAGILFHYPSGQLDRLVSGVHAIAEDEVNGPRAITAPIFGPPKNE